MSNQKTQTQTAAQQRQPCHYQMPRGVLPLGQDLLPRQTMNNIVAALCQEGLLTEAPPAAGAAYSAKYLASLNAIEDCAASHAGAAGGGFLFCGCGASPLDLNLPLSGMLHFVEECHIRLRHFSRRFVDFMAIIRYTDRYGCFAIL